MDNFLQTYFEGQNKNSVWVLNFVLSVLQTSLQKVVMTDKSGKKFLCTLPEVKEDESEGHSYPYARRSETNGSTEGGGKGAHTGSSPRGRF